MTTIVLPDSPAAILGTPSGIWVTVGLQDRAGKLWEGVRTFCPGKLWECVVTRHADTAQETTVLIRQRGFVYAVRFYVDPQDQQPWGALLTPLIPMKENSQFIVGASRYDLVREGAMVQ